MRIRFLVPNLRQGVGRSAQCSITSSHIGDSPGAVLDGDTEHERDPERGLKGALPGRWKKDGSCWCLPPEAGRAWKVENASGVCISSLGLMHLALCPEPLRP